MNEFVKTPKQCEAVRLMSGPPKHVMLYGGSRSGKSAIICRQLVIRACKTQSRHVILRLNFNHCKRSIWLDTFPKVLRLAFPNLDAKPNKTDYVYQFPNGSEIWIGGLDDSDRVDKILGTEYSSIWFNECSQIDYSSIQVAISRLAEKNSLTKKIYYDQNPPSKSHWSYWLFEKKLDPIDDVPLEHPENYASLLMNPEDNMDNLDEDYLKVLQSMPEKERNRFLKGMYTDETSGQVYYAFRRDTHVSTVTKRMGTTFIGMDFNVDPMTAVVANFVDNRLEIFDEVYLNNSDTYKMIDELKRRGFGGSQVIPDSTSKSRKTSGMSDYQILREYGFVVQDTYNPFVTDRVNNVNRLLTSNQITIDPRCKKLINDLEKVSWRDNKLDQSGESKHLTHISDALGYLAWKLLPIMKRSEQRTVQL